MIIKTIKTITKLVLTRYPELPAAHPRAFEQLKATHSVGAGKGTNALAIQVVFNRMYFLLFGALDWKLRARGIDRVDALVVRSVNGSIGIGWRAAILRSAVFAMFLSNRWLRAFGEGINEVGYRSATWAHPISDLADWFRASYHWARLKRCSDIAAYVIDNVIVGDLIIDSYLRYRPAPEFNVSDTFVHTLLWQALRDIRMATRYFHRARPKLYLMSYSTYIEHGIAARVALNEGINVWSFGNLNHIGKKLSHSDFYHACDTSEYRKIFNALDRQKERLESAREQLEIRLSGGIDAATFYMKKSAYAKTSVIIPGGLDGAVVVFLHDFYDSPHVYPGLVFDDFWQWICFTIEILQETGVAFFIKPHPNQIALSDKALELLKQKYPGLQWLPASINNVDLAKAGIACGVTVYGTIAHELAYLGISSVACAQHPHYKFDFCRTARNRDEYRRYLSSPRDRMISVEEMRDQALIFYYMHNIYGTSDELALKHAFLDLWDICEKEDSTEAEILSRFQALTGSTAFEKLIDVLSDEIS